MSEATPRPWRRCGGQTPHYTAIIDTQKRYIVFQMADYEYDLEHGMPIAAPSFEEQSANANLIVLAVNCHDELLSACKTLVRLWDSQDRVLRTTARKLAQDAIAKAQGRMP